ncbi:MAG: flagellar biosynthesis anti-sigma factor FlgM [Planctomycetes bacterium]|nr:flagellar biosynthesis anti-sigma factor FlgM [Planctomycetota bacterium]
MYRHGPTCLAGPVTVARPGWGEAFAEPRADALEIRADLVARVRREIAAGTYDTPEKLALALDRLLANLED